MHDKTRDGQLEVEAHF